MLNIIDRFLDRITMYRLILYYLIILVFTALILSFFGFLSFSPLTFLFSTIFILSVCYVSNTIFSYVYKAPTNIESLYITGLILALIITPTTSLHGLAFLGWASFLAIASKYILAIGKKHIFNPAALGVAVAAIGISQSASWWVGTASMMPFVLFGGLLIVRKIQKEDLVISFFIAALITSLFTNSAGTSVAELIKIIILDSSLFFLGFVMLIEPLTTPPTKRLQIFYGVLVGILFPPQIHIGSLYSTPELALLVGNVFSYFVSPKEKLLLVLKEKIRAGLDIIDFVFPLKKKFNFLPGQYMEWTLEHQRADNRGNRRYFTIASSPTENTLRLGVRFYENGSSYKSAMQKMNKGSSIVASQLAGDFVLPKNKNQKLVFIAGGIGVTPYRSILKFLLDTNEKRDIILLYSNKLAGEIVYADIFDLAQRNLGVKVIYTLTDPSVVPKNWKGKIGRINAQMITQDIPDFRERLFYLSGPRLMIKEFEKILKDLKITSSQIKIDFFPGYS